MHVVSSHFSEIAECVIFDRDKLPILRRQVVVEVFRMEGVEANNAAASCAVQNNCIWSIPRCVGIPTGPFPFRATLAW